MTYLGQLLLVSIPAFLTGGAAIVVVVLQQRRTRDHQDESKDEIVAALVAGQVEQDRRIGQVEKLQNRTLTRLGRMEERQLKDNERITELEGADA